MIAITKDIKIIGKLKQQGGSQDGARKEKMDFGGRFLRRLPGNLGDGGGNLRNGVFGDASPGKSLPICLLKFSGFFPG